MILASWRARRANRILIEQLHGDIVAAARRPALFRNFGAPDTPEGRFEMVALHAGLAIRRLSAIPGAGAEIAQELADSVFRHFDDGLREMGIGDTAVPKRMRRLAEAFYGRARAYGDALERPEEGRLAAALARNVYGANDRGGAPQVRALARYVERCAEALDAQGIDDFAAGRVSFPEPGGAAIGEGP
ncbi:MAG TPA: ubiquinol-cytochrome C chaperone family protein [Roseiarcus sp.]|nr:ubiquinol-cytochrome C chaperone family protein [Roseiarcus sp.]